MPLTKVTNGNWTTPRAKMNREGHFVVDDPERFYDVHMEIGVKLGTTKLVVLVHHETSPYIVEWKMTTLLDAYTAERYRRRRKDFVEEFEKQCADHKEEMPTFRTARQWMLIGSAEYDFNRKSVVEVSKWLELMIDEIADVINWTMFKLDARERFIAESDAEGNEPSVTPAIVEDGRKDDIPTKDDPEKTTPISEDHDVPFTDLEVPFPADL